MASGKPVRKRSPVSAFGLTAMVAAAMVVVAGLRAARAGEAAPGDGTPVAGESAGAGDRRRAAPRETKTVFAFQAPSTAAAWRARAGLLRDQVLASAGLLPMPERKPPRAVVTRAFETAGVRVENLAFESLPGYWVTGNLYLPRAGARVPFPAVLCPHGHWGSAVSGGRRQQDEVVSEPQRGIDFARAGMVALAWDMAGWGENSQISHLAVGGGGRAPRAGASVGGLQLWNSLRALDYLGTRREVDGTRVGVTGASGGGTQTFLLAAVDDRVRACAPVNMVSFHMQGGCVCENPPGLRTLTSNPEIAALAAPRPMLLCASTGDWTGESREREFPAIQGVYRLLGEESRVETFFQTAPHNYNRAARERVTAFFRERLLGVDLPFTEDPASVPAADLLVFPPGTARPEGYLAAGEASAAYVALIEGAAFSAWETLARDPPTGAATLSRALARRLSLFRPAPEDLAAPVAIPGGMEEGGAGAGGRPAARAIHFAAGRRGARDRVPVTLWAPERKAAQPAITLLAAMGGRFDPALAPWRERLAGRGAVVAALDLYKTVAGAEGRRAGRFAATFYKSDFAERAQDLVTAAVCLRARRPEAALSLVGVGEAGLVALLAAAAAPDLFSGVVACDLLGFDPKNDYATRLPDAGMEGVRAVESAVLALLATGGARPRALVLGGAGALARGERFAATISTAAGGDPARLAIREEAAVSPEDLGPDAEREGR